MRIPLARHIITSGLLATAPIAVARAESGLSGSPASMVHQHSVAVGSDYTFSRTPAEVTKLVSTGNLVRVATGERVALSGVSFPFARPEVSSLIDHLGRAYHEATGSRLVITSLTRPGALQPRNAHKLSVHPAGMAVDLRIPVDAADRAELERLLLALERDGMIDVTRERKPPHYHVAVFAEKYVPYAARLDSIVRVDSLASLQRALAMTPRLDVPAVAADSDADATPSAAPWLLFGGVAMLGVGTPAFIERRRRRIVVREERRRD